MKTKSMIFILVVLVSIFMISCDSDSKTTNPQSTQFKDFSDITIPENFNFETTRVLELEFIAPNKGTVIVMGDDGVEYYRALTDDIELTSRTITLPMTVKTLDFHFRSMVFADNSVADLLINPEVYLYNIEEVDEKSASKKVELYVIPILEGIKLEDDGSITSHWGYNNENNETFTQPIGSKNKFTGSGLNNSNQDQGQPTEFLPGRHYNVFTVNFTSIGNDCITWSLQSSNRLTQDACSDAPLFPGIDTDGDGVNDQDDAYPNDPDRAFDFYYPSQGRYGTLAYEDLWPDTGDYDFNDMVVKYKIKEVVSANDALMEIHFDLLLTAIGATFQNGFYFELPHPSGDVTVIETSHPESTMKTSDSGLAIIQVFNNSNDVVQVNGDFMNTVPGGTYIQPISISFVLEIDDKYDNHGSLYYPPYNPFITINHDITKEVHLPGLPPTPNADVASDYVFTTEDGAPWAVHIPHPILYPTETTDIVLAFPEFGLWVESGGTAYEDWYVNPDFDHIYSPPVRK